MSRGRTIVRNFGYLVFGKTGGDVLTFLLFVLLSNRFGREGIGAYSVAMAAGGFALTAADFGLYNFSIRSVSRQVGGETVSFGAIFPLRLLLTALVSVLLVAAAAAAPVSPVLVPLLLLLGAYNIVYALFNGLASVFVSHERMRTSAALELSLRATIAIGGIAVVLAGGGLTAAVAVFPVATLAHVALAHEMVRRRYGAPPFTARWHEVRRTARAAAPFAVSSVLNHLSTRMDVLLVGAFAGTAAAGVYNVGYRFLMLLLFLPHFASMALFPSASRLYLHSREELRGLYHRSLGLAVVVALPVAAGLWLVAPKLVAVIFGAEFRGSVAVLRVLAWGIVFASLARVMAVFLMAGDREVRRTRVQWTAGWISLAVHLALIPLIGAVGAAIGALTYQVLAAGLSAWHLHDLIGWPRIGSRLAIAAIGAAAFCVPFAPFPGLPLPLVISASVAIYAGVLLLFPSIRRDELRELRAWLRDGRVLAPAESG